MAIFPFSEVKHAYSENEKLYFKSVELDNSIVEMCKGRDVMGTNRIGQELYYADFIGGEINMLALVVAAMDETSEYSGVRTELIEILEKQEADGTVCY